MVFVSLALAVICFNSSCYPALVGPDTPTGTFQLVLMNTTQPGYGGDVLKFKETEDSWWAIHRVWALRPEEHRIERLQSGNASQRITITKGCINVMPDVYEKLKACCSSDKLLILKR